MDDFSRIVTFIKVVEAGSFSAAARNQSSVSSVARQVKSLEDDLGVRLLNRSTRSLSLTEPGRILYERARGISNDLNNAISETSSFKDSVKGVLKVALRVSTGTTIIVPALPGFLQEHPDLTLDVTLTDERNDLIASNIDVAVWMGDLPNSEIVARRLTPSQRIVCGAPSYFEQHGIPQTAADLAQHNCLLFSPRAYSNVWEFTRGGEHERVPVHGSLRTDNGLVLLSAALAGLGLIVVHEWMVRRLLAEGRMMRVLADYAVNPTTGEADLFAVYSSSRGMSRKVRVFVDFLVQLFSGQQPASPPAGNTSPMR
jgi:DNA-binding transcriptional LysR family regulator